MQRNNLQSIRRLTVVLGSLSVVCCLPAILGVLGTVLPTLIRPGRHWAMETPWERAMVSVFEWSTLVALLSPPATLIGVGLGVWAAARAGWRSRFSKMVVSALASAVSLSAGGAVWMYTTTHRAPDPAAEQPIESLPLPIRALHDRCGGGDAEACLELAVQYDHGEGVPRSGTVALRYYARGCDLGDANSCMNGGTLCFYGGADPAPDPARGLDLLQRACQRNHALGCLKIGIVHQLGHGVEVDPTVAAEHFRRACELGLSSGCKWSKEVEGQ